MDKIFESVSGFLTSVTGSVNNALYGYLLIILLIAAGLFFAFRTGFVQFRLLGAQLKAVTEKPKNGKGVSSFQALMVSTASRVGTGNIIGVATAIGLGGIGSIFWMWVIAIIGGATAFIESTLSQIYKKRGPDGSYGGPAYYIEGAFKKRGLAVLFSVILVITYGVGFNMLASYNLQSTFKTYGFYKDGVTSWIIGLIIAVLVAVCLFGGGKRILKVTSVCVPFMGALYILVALVVIGMNLTSIPSVLGSIFKNAFDFQAIFGGFTGSCVMYGIKRGLFSNEAGVGSAPNASASADVSHPVKQGLVQIISVFIDTLLVCTATAFMCVCSGVDPAKCLDAKQEFDAAIYVQSSLYESFGAVGPIFITVAMVLFAFTTLLGNLFYVDKAFFHILKRKPSKNFNTVYYILASLLIFVGAGLKAGLLWDIADITMGLMTLINIPVIILLSKYAVRALKDFEAQRKQGKDPEFIAACIGIKDETDYWNAEE